jgi:hypothetical protein
VPSPTAQLASAQAFSACQSLQQYRGALPLNTMPYHGQNVCRRDGWHIDNDSFSGDFDIDPVLAQQLVGGVLASSDLATPASDIESFWLHDYLYGGPSSPPGTTQRLFEESKSAMIGPGGILGNVNTAMSAAHAAHAGNIDTRIQAGAQKILSGQSQSVRINQYVTLYNGNTSGKGRPRPRIRISNMPIHIVQPTVGPHARYHGGTQTVTEALKNAKLKEIAPKVSPLARLYIKGAVGGGLITFAPSAILDLTDSINRDTQGKLKFDAKYFAIASARSQSGNLLGAALSYGASAGIAYIGGAAIAASAPIIITLAIVGIGVSIFWGTAGYSDKAASMAKQYLEK